MRAQFVAMLSILIVAPAWAATYKCQDAQGNWTEQACPDYQRRMGEKAREAALQQAQSANPQQAQDAPPPPQQMKKKTAIDAISDEVADNDCRRAAKNAYQTPSMESIEKAQAEIAQLQNERFYFNDTSGTSTYRAQSLEQQNQLRIATLRQLISTEQARNDSIRAESDRIYADAIRRCDDEKAKRDQN